MQHYYKQTKSTVCRNWWREPAGGNHNYTDLVWEGFFYYRVIPCQVNQGLPVDDMDFLEIFTIWSIIKFMKKCKILLLYLQYFLRYCRFRSCTLCWKWSKTGVFSMFFRNCINANIFLNLVPIILKLSESTYR